MQLELTKSHLRQLQRELNGQGPTSSPSLYDSRIEILLLHEDEILKLNESQPLDSSQLDDKSLVLNSSMENFQNVKDNHEEMSLEFESTLNIDGSQLRDIQVKVKDDNGISGIFDADNTSLLYVNKQEDTKKISATLKDIDPNVGSSTKQLKQPSVKSKIPLAGSITKGPTRFKTRSSSSIGAASRVQNKSSTITNLQSNGSKIQSKIDLKFPNFDSLVEKLAHKRSLK